MFVHHAAGAGAGGPSVPSPWYQAALAELIYTTLLCFAFCSCLTSKRNNLKDDSNQFFGLSIGLAMVAGGHAAGGICGAMFNPAVALGLTAIGGYFSQALLWILFQLLGGLLAAGLFRLTRPEELTWSEAALLAGDFKSQLYVRCLSEFLGTFMLVFTVGLNLVQGSPAVAWAAAAALASMIYFLGSVSGGHFNPAVTLAVVLSDRDTCSPQDGLLYLVS
ncbi:unnamed protein product [Polarella glacialis]|uniref:Aquaporin n=1 Tax=Polarella glacialis TaxID=89957 RepID=A0A813LLT7_POLGL|nr:unnamed protein product [Polarella glacialis]